VKKTISRVNTQDQKSTSIWCPLSQVGRKFLLSDPALYSLVCLILQLVSIPLPLPSWTLQLRRTMRTMRVTKMDQLSHLSQTQFLLMNLVHQSLFEAIAKKDWIFSLRSLKRTLSGSISTLASAALATTSSMPSSLIKLWIYWNVS
jgi:hypothetical protein